MTKRQHREFLHERAVRGSWPSAIRWESPWTSAQAPIAAAWRRLAGQNLLPKRVANVKFKDGLEASPLQARTAA